MTSSFTFKPLGPAPIQDPLFKQLNTANPWGSGIASGAINSLAMRQDLNTKSGWLYAGSVNGGIWGSKYNGTTDTWDSWQLLSNTSSYQGAQSIGKLQLTENQKWLIAGKGNPSTTHKYQEILSIHCKLPKYKLMEHSNGWSLLQPLK